MPVPWTHILRWAPEIITISRELMARSRGKSTGTEPVTVDSPSELAARIAMLEENERRQAELVERMAEQQAHLARAVLELHKRERLLIVGLGVLTVALLAVVTWVALR